MADQSTHQQEYPLLEAFDRQSLDSLIESIINSRALGRSKIYKQLLTYLVDRTTKAAPPKEIEIAIDVLGRDASFDVAKDSVVRVYIHQLRKKLDRYYEEFHTELEGSVGQYRIIIPKGEYTIAAQQLSPPITDATSTNTHHTSETSSVVSWPRYLLIAACFLLVANLVMLFVMHGNSDSSFSEKNDVAKSTIWQPIIDNNTPLLIVLGDYYIFGELDEAGNVRRMVREFDINSPVDLEDLFMTEPELAWKYYNLDLTYIPEGSAFAINSISSVLPHRKKSIEVKMMSDLTTQDITTHHIIYLGYISGLDHLSDMVFAASGLKIGGNYDELIDKETGKTFTSDAGLPSFREPFVDFGYMSLIRSTNQTFMLVVAGMRDAGLIHTAKALTQTNDITRLNEALSKSENSTKFDSYEALFEVRGLNRKNFSADIIYTNFVDSKAIWKNDFFKTSSSALP